MQLYIFSALIKITGWIIIFYFNWKIGVGIFMIEVANQIQRGFIEEIRQKTLSHINESIKNIISSLDSLLQWKEKKDSEDITKN